MSVPSLSSGEDNFLHVLSHDLREPARMVSQFLKLIKMKTENQMDATSEEYLNFAITASNKMDEMIKGLTQINNAQNYKEALSTFTVNETLNLVKLRRETEICKREATIVVSGDQKVTGRSDLFHQVLDELILNSLLHAKNSEPLEILISVEQLKDNGICLIVEDNGAALDEFWQKRAFEPYKKENRNSKLLGIGLTRLQILINRFGGKINLFSSKQGHTCVSCELL